MANPSILAAFERMWHHVTNALSTKSDITHTHDDMYYTESEVDAKISDVNTSITDIKEGNIVIKEAEHAGSANSASHAGSADSATMATKDGEGNVISSTYETKSDADNKLATAKEYADSVGATVKNDLLNGAGEAYDTLKELSDLIVENVDAIDALENIASGKANADHNHDENYADIDHNHDGAYDAIGSANAALNSAKEYTEGQDAILQNQIEEINDVLADLLYEAITFTSFSNNIGTVELGTTVNSVALTWGTNKTPTTLTLDDESIDVNLKAYTYNDLALSPTSVTTKSYTIKATDERNASASKTTSISFVNGVYYGVIDESAEINSATVLSMTRKLQNSRSMTVTITPSSTEYIAFAFPTRLGTPMFKMGGFETTCNCTTIQFTNASGYTESYNVYTTNNTGLGKTEVVVS